MQIVIEIPETMIQELKDGCFGVKHNVYELAGCIMNGTALPEQHDRLIDADAFERRCMFDVDIEDMQDVIYALRDYPTILEGTVNE